MNIVIGLNVGGHVYKTKRDTLTLYPESVLGRKFHDRVPKEKDVEGNYVLDRDGPMFRYVLNFLRSGKLALPGGFSEFGQLTQEAEFFRIPGLLEATKQAARESTCAPTYLVAEHVTNSDTEKRKWRIKSDNIDVLWRISLGVQTAPDNESTPHKCEENSLRYYMELQDHGKKPLFEKIWSLGFIMNTLTTEEQACYEFVRKLC